MIKKITIIAMLLFISSCGTLFYSERNFGPKSDRIDYFVLGLDAIGFVAFVIPGFIMLGVDYATGALWLSKEENEIYIEDALEQSKVREYIFN